MDFCGIFEGCGNAKRPRAAYCRAGARLMSFIKFFTLFLRLRSSCRILQRRATPYVQHDKEKINDRKSTERVVESLCEKQARRGKRAFTEASVLEVHERGKRSLTKYCAVYDANFTPTRLLRAVWTLYRIRSCLYAWPRLLCGLKSFLKRRKGYARNPPS